MSTTDVPMFAQVNKYFDKAASYLEHPPGLLEQIKECTSVFRISFPKCDSTDGSPLLAGGGTHPGAVGSPENTQARPRQAHAQTGAGTQRRCSIRGHDRVGSQGEPAGRQGMRSPRQPDGRVR